MHTKFKKYFCFFGIIIFTVVFLGCEDKKEIVPDAEPVEQAFTIEKKPKASTPKPEDDQKPFEKTPVDEVDSDVEGGLSDKKSESGTEEVLTDKTIVDVEEAVIEAEKEEPVTDKTESEKLDNNEELLPVADEINDEILPLGTYDAEEESGKMYDPKGRVDPFAPLFQPVAETVVRASNKIKTVRDIRMPRLTPLEKLDLSQLKLTGVLKMPTAQRSIAMVEEATGKGHVVKKGTYIGVHSGRVVEITSDRVLIEEEVENYMGDIVVRKRELKLQKPLGER